MRNVAVGVLAAGKCARVVGGVEGKQRENAQEARQACPCPQVLFVPNHPEIDRIPRRTKAVATRCRKEQGCIPRCQSMNQQPNESMAKMREGNVVIWKRSAKNQCWVLLYCRTSVQHGSRR